MRFRNDVFVAALIRREAALWAQRTFGRLNRSRGKRPKDRVRQTPCRKNTIFQADGRLAYKRPAARESVLVSRRSRCILGRSASIPLNPERFAVVLHVGNPGVLHDREARGQRLPPILGRRNVKAARRCAQC